jgi:uncharacterized protein YdhG (YjbR/CyaY superfamily)
LKSWATSTKIADVAEKPTSVEQYMLTLPDDVQLVLREVRNTIHEAIIGAEDCISYAIPAVKVDGKVVVYYSGWKSHVSVYPIPPGTAAFQKRIAPYVAGKGTLKFLLSEPIPHKLIAEISTAHLKRHKASMAAKAQKTKAQKTKTKR